MRVRDDKSHPNGYTTAKSQLHIIRMCRDNGYDSCSYNYRCVSEYSSASDKGVAFGGDREASLEASPQLYGSWHQETTPNNHQL